MGGRHEEAGKGRDPSTIEDDAHIGRVDYDFPENGVEVKGAGSHVDDARRRFREDLRVEGDPARQTEVHGVDRVLERADVCRRRSQTAAGVVCLVRDGSVRIARAVDHYQGPGAGRRQEQAQCA